MRRLRLLTAGESHGPAVSGVLEGLPYGLRISTEQVNRDLRRRQHGYGSGRRMLIEKDEVVWMGGLRFGRTLGSPLAFRIENLDWANWQDKMSVERLPARGRPRAVTLARPGHADLAGAIKYGTNDIRDVLERASARSTAVRVLAGAVCRQLLSAVGVGIWSYVEQVGSAKAFPDAEDSLACVPEGWPAADLASPSPLRCPDPAAEELMIAEIDAAAEAGDSVGGAFVVVVQGLPIGLGSAAEWDTRLDGALAAALMAIPAVKAVAVGDGFHVAGKRGSDVHDEVDSGATGWARRTNRAGGIEGGMSNGMPIVLRVAVKPVSTLRKPLDSVDIVSGKTGRAHIERSDIAIMPRAAIVGEAMAALVLADALLTSFGGDTMADLRAAVARRRRRESRPTTTNA
jgi:chorismate synthase